MHRVISRAVITRYGLVALPLAFLCFMNIIPLLRLLWQGGGQVSWSLFTDPYLRWHLVWSFTQAGATCLLAVMVGVPVAWVMARFNFTGRALLMRVLMLPFVMPTLVAAIGVLALWGPQGITGINLQDTPWLLLYGNLFFNLPLVIRSSVDGLQSVPAHRLAAARVLGASPWRAFWRVEWPALLPWLGSGLSLVFLYCFSGFGLALLLGGQRYTTLEVEIYSLVANELNLADAGALAVVVLVVCGLCAALYAWLEARLKVLSVVQPLPRRRPEGWADQLALWLAVGLLLFFAGLPLLMLVWKGIMAWSSVDWHDDEIRLALFNTGRFTLMAVSGAAAMGLVHAWVAQGRVWLRGLMFLPFIISPVCMALGLLLLYPAWMGSLWMLLAAYVLLAYPFVAKSVISGLDTLPVSIPGAARTLGASPWRVFYRVLWPLLQPVFWRGVAFAAATALGEFAVTLFLSRPEWLTLTTLVYQRLGRPGQVNRDTAMALSLILMVGALLAFVLIEWPRRQKVH